MKKHTILFVLFILVSLSSFAYDKDQQPGITQMKGNTLSFVENKGQVTDQDNKPKPDIQYKVAAANGLNIFIGNGTIHYQFSRPDHDVVYPSPMEAAMGKNIPEHITYIMCRMDLELVGAAKNAKVIAEEPRDEQQHYFTHNSGSAGLNARACSRITYQSIYPNIDWVLYISNGQIKYEFVVRPGGKVSDIRLKYGGADALSLNRDGSLTATTAQGTITEQAPISFDAHGLPVRSNFVLKGNVVSYAAGNYTGTLVIDPTLSWATYYGGSGNDLATGVATDHSGNVYITGNTTSVSGIATTGAYLTTYTANTDAYIAKFTGAGTPIWATYYGSDSTDFPYAVATDPAGNVYIAGNTSGLTGIATTGANQAATGGGPNDAFLAKFNSNGALQWATYFGGAGDEKAFSLSADGTGNIYMCGQTNSTAGIATPGAFQTIYGGSNNDVFLAKYNNSGALQWATYYGGNSDEGYHCAVSADTLGGVYFTTYTQSAGLASPGAYHTANAGYADVLLVKFNGAGVRQWATYFGGPSSEFGWALTTDNRGSVYVTGYTYSLSGITSPGAHQVIFNGANDGFLARFDSAGAFQWATYYGGYDVEYGYGLTTDAYGYVYLMGNTESNSFIATPGSYQPTFAGYIDPFIAIFNEAGTRLWATYYGGNSDDQGWGIATNGVGGLFVAGAANSTSGIATTGSYHPTSAGGLEAFLLKFCIVPQAGTITGAASVCVSRTITLSVSVSGGTWSASNNRATVAANVVTGVTPGLDTIRYVVTNPCGNDTAKFVITVNPLPDAGTITGPASVCVGSIITLSAGTMAGTWSSSTTSKATIGSSGIVAGVAGGSATISYIAVNVCGADTATRALTVNPLPDAGTLSGATAVCVGNTIILSHTATGGLWSSTNAGTTVSGTGVVSGVSVGNATIRYIVTNSCGSDTALHSVTVETTLSPGTLSGPDSVCVNATISITGASPGGTWSAGAGGYATVTAGIVSGLVTGIAPGLDTIFYTVTNSCGNVSTVKYVYVKDCSNAAEHVLPYQEVSIFPNPVENVVTINAPMIISDVSVTNMMGQVIYASKPNSRTVDINMAHAAPGLYLVTINNIAVYKITR